MNEQPNEDSPDPDALDRLIDDAARGTAAPDTPVAELLAAATVPDEARVQAGEESALAAFRAAQDRNAEPHPVGALSRPRNAFALAALAVVATAVAVFTTLNSTAASEPGRGPQGSVAPGAEQHSVSPGGSQPSSAMNSSSRPQPNTTPPSATSSSPCPPTPTAQSSATGAGNGSGNGNGGGNGNGNGNAGGNGNGNGNGNGGGNGNGKARGHDNGKHATATPCP